MRLRQHQHVLREIKEIKAKFSFQKSVLGTLAGLESVLGKIIVCHSGLFVCVSHGIACALLFKTDHLQPD